MKIYRYNALGKADYGWLKTSYHFSFSNYYNPNKVHLGPLRVINDDYIAPFKGFDTHPHNNMEIITYVIDGKLTHKDSMGNERTLGPGGVQYMSAGTGITHSEYNKHDEELHLFQTWIIPDKKNITPNYGDFTVDQKELVNNLVKIISPLDGNGLAKINQHSSIEVGIFDKGNVHDINIDDFKSYYMVLIEGEVDMNGETIYKGDGVSGDKNIRVVFEEKTHLFLVKV